VVGKIYAFSTLGSIVGTFATGFLLIELMGTRTLLFTTAAVLMLCAPLFGGAFRRRRAALVAFALFAVALPAAAAATHEAWFGLYARAFRLPQSRDGTLYSRESSYFTITVSEEPREDGKGLQRVLVLDNLRHAACDPDDPTFLYYEYLKYYEEVVRWQAA